MDDDIASNLGTMDEHNVFVLAQALLNSSVSGKSFLSLPILVYNPVHSYEYTFHTFANTFLPAFLGCNRRSQTFDLAANIPDHIKNLPGFMFAA
jgi:hypothetical protein